VDQYDEEQVALDRLRQVSALLLGQEERGADPPDFIVAEGGRRIGVEMTRYHHDSGPGGSEGAKHESLERKVMTLGEGLFEASNPGAHVRVSPYFRRGTLRRGNVPHVAERLARLVATTIPLDPTDSEPLTSRRADWDALDRAGLSEVLITLTVYRWRRMRAGEWYPPVGGGVSTDVSSIELRLRAKENDLPSYRARVDESWLVIYAPLGHASAFFDTEVLTPQMFKSTFDRVIYIDLFSGRYVVVA
jgi:hypothetical protein